MSRVQVALWAASTTMVPQTSVLEDHQGALLLPSVLCTLLFPHH